MKWLLALAAVSFLPARNVERPRITGVAHIALYAQDFEAARAFYRDFLGFEEPYSLTGPDGSPSMTFFKVNERQYIELSPETAPGSDRLNHIAIETNNAEAMRQYLAAHGVAVPASVGKGRIGNSNFNIHDPEGHTVEIVQYQPDSWTVRERGRHLPARRVSSRIMHVGIIVTAFDSEMKFYRDLLGFRETWRGSRTPAELNWVNLQVPDGQDYIELMLYKDAPPPGERGTAHHLALEVPDTARAVAALDAGPYRKQYARPIEIRTGINRRRQVNLFDPDGTRTELMEPDTVDSKPAPSSQAPPPGSATKGPGVGIFDSGSDVGAVLHAGSLAYAAAQHTDSKPAPSSQAPPPGSAAKGPALGIFDNEGDVGAVLHAGSLAYDAAQHTYSKPAPSSQASPPGSAAKGPALGIFESEGDVGAVLHAGSLAYRAAQHTYSKPAPSSQAPPPGSAAKGPALGIFDNEGDVGAVLHPGSLAYAAAQHTDSKPAPSSQTPPPGSAAKGPGLGIFDHEGDVGAVLHAGSLAYAAAQRTFSKPALSSHAPPPDSATKGPALGIFDNEGDVGAVLHPGSLAYAATQHADSKPAPSSQAPPPGSATKGPGVGIFDNEGDVGAVLHAGSLAYDAAQRTFSKPALSSHAPPPDSATKGPALGIFDNEGDVGAVLHAGSLAYDATQHTYTIAGSGENMWFASDALHFAWKKVEGDAMLTADVSFLGSGGDPHRKAVLMMRESLDADAAYADAALHGDGLASLQSREEKGAATHEIQSRMTAPKRLRLTRQGQYFYMSIGGEDGNMSLAGGWMRVPFSGTFYVGIGLCAHNKDVVEKVVFSNVELSTAARTGNPVLYSTLETVKVASTDRRVAYVTPGRVESPSWTSDGAALVFLSGGRSRRLALDTGKLEDIGAPSTTNKGLDLSPDGKYVYFSSEGGGANQIWRKAADGARPEQLTAGEYSNWFPHVSPDGRSVAFVSYPKGVAGCPEDKDVAIRLLTLAGGNIRILARLIGGCASMDAPSWSPDGTRVAFVSYQSIQ